MSMRAFRVPATIIGVLLLFVAERYFADSAGQLWFRIAAFAFAIFGAVCGYLQASSAKSPREAQSFRFALIWQIGVVVSLLLYLAYDVALGEAFTPETALHKVLLGAWLVTLVLSLVSGIGYEIAIKGVGQGFYGDPLFVSRQGKAWFLIGQLAVFLVSLNYFGSRIDKAYDWSYLKTASPSESTQQMVKTLTEKLEIGLFYPKSNEVLVAVESYFKAAAANDDNVVVNVWDKDRSPSIAEEWKVKVNGQIVLRYGQKREVVDTGIRLKGARKTLAVLDEKVQRAFLKLTSATKVVYFTRGHGEFDSKSSSADRSVQLLKNLFRNQNYRVEYLTLDSGSTEKVPTNASLVVSIAPSRPFLPAEARALRTYIENGGKMMAMLDIDSDLADASEDLVGETAEGETLETILQSFGVHYDQTPAAHDKRYVVATKSDVDKWFLATNNFSSHSSVSTLSQHDERIGVLLFRSGSITLKQHPSGWNGWETVRSLGGTFVDKNKNYAFDKKDEKRAILTFGVALSKSIEAKKDEKEKKSANDLESRITVFSDATAFTDGLIRNQGNLIYAVEAIRWLVGHQEVTGIVSSEEDVKIQHSREEDLVWFYSSVVFGPLLVVGTGAFATRRRRRRRGGQHDA